ncbi:MAG: PilZ domain-containing protein [Bdellovibrionota bacterium]
MPTPSNGQTPTQPEPFSVPRKHPRIPLTIEVRCEGAGAAERFLTKDVSAGGVFLFTTRVYPMGANVEVAFYIPYHHQEIRSKGKVVRHSQNRGTGLVDGMAIEFEGLSEAARESIDRYMERTKK